MLVHMIAYSYAADSGHGWLHKRKPQMEAPEREGIALDSKKFSVLGGDKRNIYLAKELEIDGHRVSRYGFHNYDCEKLDECRNLYEAIDGSDYIVCPIPCSHNGIDLNAVYSGKIIAMDDIFRLIKPKQRFLAGYIKEQVLETARKYEVECTDILKREELAVMNAVPTAFHKCFGGKQKKPFCRRNLNFKLGFVFDQNVFTIYAIVPFRGFRMGDQPFVDSEQKLVFGGGESGFLG